MDELTNQLRSYGEATEHAVPPTPAEAVRSGVNQIGVETQPATGRLSPQKPAPRRRGIVLAAAAAFIVAAVGSAIFLRMSEEMPAGLDTANQTESTTQEFAVPDDDNGWRELRFCESTENYQVDSGNTFYGAYQFTWESFRLTIEQLGLVDYVGVIPSSAPAEIQDAAANALYLEQGDEPWPVCGRFIDGPMITPVVPQWVGQFGRGGASILVFLDPEVEPERIDEVRDELEDILGSAVGESMTFVSQQEAFDEFQLMFTGSEQMRNSVTVDAMPASFRIRGPSTSRGQAIRIGALDGVFQVIEPDPFIVFDPPPPMKLAIPTLDVAVPVQPAATIEALEKGPVVLAGNAVAPVMAGYGSVEGAVFEQLDLLSPGDRLTVTTLVQGADQRFDNREVTRSYSVTEVVETDLSELGAWNEAADRGLTLIADVADDPTKRVIVHSEPVVPETASYGIESDN